MSVGRGGVFHVIFGGFRPCPKAIGQAQNEIPDIWGPDLKRGKRALGVWCKCQPSVRTIGLEHVGRDGAPNGHHPPLDWAARKRGY
jgi:hypothetical protein